MRDDIYHDFLQLIGDTAEIENLNDPRLIIDARINGQSEFLTQVETLLAALPKYERVMTPIGIDADYIARLKRATDELRAMTDSRERHWGSRSGATGGLEAASKAVRDYIGQVDGVLFMVKKRSPSFKADWDASRKIHKTRVEPRRGGSVVLPPDDETPT
jgi:hypothetical protein